MPAWRSRRPGLGVGQSANAIRHSGVQCDLGGQLFRAEQHRAGTSVPNQRRQPADAPVIQGQTVFRRRKLEEGIGRDNPQVALHGKLQAGADGGTVDRADHWHRGGVHRLVQLDEPVGIIGGECVSAQVRASAERGAWPVSTIARADPSPAFRMACVSSSTAGNLRRCGAPGVAAQWSARLLPG